MAAYMIMSTCQQLAGGGGQSDPVVHLLERVHGSGTIGALGRPVGAVVADVVTDAIPQVLCGQGRLQDERKHGEKQDRLHGHRQRARDFERWT